MTGFNYYVYILTNKRNTVLYIGITNNLPRRIEEHLLVSTNDFVRKYNLIKLIYVETFTDPLTAITNLCILRLPQINLIMMIKINKHNFIFRFNKFKN